VGQAGILTEGLVRRFGSLVALDGVNISVEPGEVVVLLGPNGAGKSTLIRTLATTLLPDAGRVWVGGFDVVAEPRAALAGTGLVLSEDRSFFWRMSGAANLEFFAALHGLRKEGARRRAASCLAMVGLSEVGGRRVDRYSTGMRARLGIARALLGRPRVLLLDEPTRSLDPLVAVEVRRLVLRLTAEQGVACLFATHDLHEAAAVSSGTIVLAGGQVRANIPPGTDAAGLEDALLEAVG
jgi:ABC-2 type transport system ATP-binding protein